MTSVACLSRVDDSHCRRSTVIPVRSGSSLLASRSCAMSDSSVACPTKALAITAFGGLTDVVRNDWMADTIQILVNAVCGWRKTLGILLMDRVSQSQ